MPLSTIDAASLARINWAIVLIGGALLGWAWHLHRKRRRLRQSGFPATGVVIRLEPDYHPEGNTYTPIFRFTTLNHEVVEVKHWYGSYPPAYRLGQPVSLLYNPRQPQEYILASGPAWQVLLCLLAGTACILGAFCSHFAG